MPAGQFTRLAMGVHKNPPRHGPKKWSRISADSPESISISLNRIEVDGAGYGLGAFRSILKSRVARKLNPISLNRTDVDGAGGVAL